MSTDSPFGAFVRKPRGEAAPPAPKQGEVAPADPARGTGEDGADAEPSDLIELGVIGEAYGVRGQVKVYPHAEAGNGGTALLDARRWWLARGDERRVCAVEAAKVHVKAVVAQLAGCADRDAAEALKGFRVFARRADFGKPAEDEFYWVDLIGAQVLNEAGVALGTVAGLLDNGAHSVLRVTPEGEAGGERLIPFVDAYVKEVDVGQGRIVVDWDLDY